jgi:predicted RNA-binding Zn-ribbon protein involved in translation (DUF1610 family)
MAEVIQFNCPSCGTLLRLPLALAACQGPCPNCGREIIAPDPDRGSGAHEAVPEVAVPPVVGKPRRKIPVISNLLTGALGFALGVISYQHFAQTQRVIPPVKAEKPAVIAEPPAPIPEPPKPVIEKSPEPPAKASAAAEISLRAFLEAPDWAARSAYVLFPEKMRAAMESYSREAPDGPTAFKSISVKHSHIDEQTGNTLLIFYVATETFPAGIPVAIKETSGGWLVDWQSFVEFRDQLFQKFVDGPADRTGHFHLVATLPPPERAAKTGNEHFSSFLLQSPLDAKPQLAFVKKPSEILTAFQSATQNGGIFTPLLEVAKRQTADGKSYLEVLKVTATDWLPQEN